MNGLSYIPSILIVDDTPENLDILSGLLSAYKRKIALNGETALKIANSGNPPDLILLDIMMPGMDGYEVIEKLKSNNNTKHIPVIFVSALNDIEDETKGFKLGAADYITKPFHPAIVEARVKTHLNLVRTTKRADQLLENILPRKIINDLMEDGFSMPEHFEDVTILFTDLVGFTSISSKTSADDLITELNEIFSAFDEITYRNGGERIKTIGDAYMAACGVPVSNNKHAEIIIEIARGLIDFLNERNRKNLGLGFQLRAGISTGPVVGAVVGKTKYVYDIFGDTVNTASRMESNSEPMRINISQNTYDLVKDKFKLIDRGEIAVKGKGVMNMYFLE